MNKIERKKSIAFIQEHGRNTRLIENAPAKAIQEAKSSNGSTPSVVRYAETLEAIAALAPVWSALSGREQDVLMEMYGRKRLRNGAASRLSTKLELSERQIYRHSTHALQHFHDELVKNNILQEDK